MSFLNPHEKNNYSNFNIGHCPIILAKYQSKKTG